MISDKESEQFLCTETGVALNKNRPESLQFTVNFSVTEQLSTMTLCWLQDKELDFQMNPQTQNSVQYLQIYRHAKFWLLQSYEGRRANLCVSHCTASNTLRY